MKKALTAVLLFVALGISTSGQDYRTALGLRAGFPYGITVKHFLNETNALEGILASSWGGFVATALYENEHWTGQYPGLNWFWGLGAHIGFWDPEYNIYIDDTGPVLGADLIAGLEYTFDEIPLNLSLDILPSFNLIGAKGWGGIHGGLSIRYVF
ncbi:MAG TPA: hypothetical protein VMW76_00420 [Bacteroidales bacterium]|nr:hypothetical protein [Bacteroidales bacterium]